MPFKVAQFAAVLILLTVLTEQNSVVYEFSKFFVSAIAANSAYLNVRQNRSGWAAASLAIVIVFNPLVPPSQSKEAWLYAEFLAASTIFCAMFAESRKSIKFPVTLSVVAALVLFCRSMPPAATMSQNIPIVESADTKLVETEKSIQDKAKQDAYELSLPATTDTEPLVPDTAVPDAVVEELAVPPPPVIPLVQESKPFVLKAAEENRPELTSTEVKPTTTEDPPPGTSEPRVKDIPELNDIPTSTTIRLLPPNHPDVQQSSEPPREVKLGTEVQKVEIESP